MGGLMQLVAYGALDVHLKNYGETNSTTFNFGKKSSPQFFYDKVKKSLKTKKDCKGVQFTKPKEKPKTPGEIFHVPKIKKLNMFEKANKNFGGQIIRKFNIHINKRKIIGEILSKYVVSITRFNFSHKDKMIEMIRPVINMLRKQLYIRSSIDYFTSPRVKLLGLAKNTENFTKNIKNLDSLLILHQFLINQIDLANPIVKIPLKNTTCPISLGEITNQYIECTTCKTCFDYSNHFTNSWFTQHNKCAVCRQQFQINIRHINGENIIYSELKKNAKNT